MFRRLKLFLVSCLMLITSLGLVAPMQVQAADCNSGYIEIAPHWSHTASIATVISVPQNGVVRMSGTVFGNTGTSHIVVDAVLDRVNPNGTTTTVNRWNNIRQDGSFWGWSRDWAVARGHHYRWVMVVRTHRNGQVETIVAPSTIIFVP